MAFLRQHWLPLVVLVLALTFFVDACQTKHENERLDRENVELLERVAAANARASDARAYADSVAARSDSLDAIRAASTDTAFLYITRWRTRVDTLTVEHVVALADSAVAACANALTDCQRSASAGRAAIRAKDVALERFAEEIAAREAYAASLEERLGGGDPFWTTPVLTLAGAGLGFALDGWDGAFKGAGLGFSADIVYRGLRSLTGSIP